MKRQKLNRNDICHCGSGKKYKKCCLPKDIASDVYKVAIAGRPRSKVSNTVVDSGEFLGRAVWKASATLSARLLDFTYEHYVGGVVRYAWSEYCPSEHAHDMWEDFCLFCTFDDSHLPSPCPFPTYIAVFFQWFFHRWTPAALEGRIPMKVPSHLSPVGAFKFLQLDKDLPPLEAELLQKSCEQPFTFYKILESKPGVGVKVKGILQDTTYFVHESLGSYKMEVGYILFAQVVCVQGIGLFHGCGTLPIPPRYEESILRLRDVLEDALECDKINDEILRGIDVKVTLPIYWDIQQEEDPYERMPENIREILRNNSPHYPLKPPHHPHNPFSHKGPPRQDP